MKFIGKHLQEMKPQKSFLRSNQLNSEIVKEKEIIVDNNDEKKDEVKKTVRKKKNKIEENKSDMNTAEKIAMAKEILGTNDTLKVLKKDKGLIERTESSKTILTEDNKELLVD
jgi:hypothetical protein